MNHLLVKKRMELLGPTSTLTQEDLRLPRFHHPSHPHKLFRNIVRNMAIFCDNKNCARRLHNNEVSFVCFRCDYDLCAQCFMLPTEEPSICQLHLSDDEIDDSVLFIPDRFPTRAKCVRVVEEDEDEDEEQDEEQERNTCAFEEDGHTQKDEEKNDNEYKEPDTQHSISRVATITFESQEYDDSVTQSVNELLSGVAANVRVIPHIRSHPPPPLHSVLESQVVRGTVSTIPPPPTNYMEDGYTHGEEALDVPAAITVTQPIRRRRPRQR